MFDNLFTLAGTTGTAVMLLALLLGFTTALMIGMWSRERDRLRLELRQAPGSRGHVQGRARASVAMRLPPAPSA